MQMSKQEKIIVFVLLVLVILGVGFFMFILPNFNDIDKNQKNLDAANSSYSDILSQLEREKTIDSDIKAEYEIGKDLADGFYNDLTPVEADEIMRQFIAKGNDIRINGLTVGPMATEALSISLIGSPTVSYPLKDFSQTMINDTAVSAVDPDSMTAREKLMYLKDAMSMLLALSEPVTVGVSTVSFTAYSDELENLHNFADTLNAGIYDDTIVDEDGNPQRKATYLVAANFELAEKSSEILTNAYDGANGSAPESVESSQESSVPTDNAGWGRYRMDFTVKLYCIEPVADPFGGNTESAADTTTTSEAA